MIVSECFPRTDAYDTDIADEWCDGTTDFEDIRTGHWHIGSCSHDRVNTGVVNGRARFAVQSTSSEYDDLPF